MKNLGKWQRKMDLTKEKIVLVQTPSHSLVRGAPSHLSPFMLQPVGAMLTRKSCFDERIGREEGNSSDFGAETCPSSSLSTNDDNRTLADMEIHVV